MLRPPESFFTAHSNTTSVQSSNALVFPLTDEFNRNNNECNTLILSFRTGFPVNGDVTETILDTPSRQMNQQNSLVKHAVIRREKKQNANALSNTTVTNIDNIDFDDLDEDDDRPQRQQIVGREATHYVYKCGKLGPHGSLLQILR